MVGHLVIVEMYPRDSSSIYSDTALVSIWTKCAFRADEYFLKGARWPYASSVMWFDLGSGGHCIRKWVADVKAN